MAGFVAVMFTALKYPGSVANLVVFIALVWRIGLYAAVAGSYVGMAVTMMLYWLNNRPWGVRMGATAALSTAVPAISALLAVIYDPWLRWPTPQLLATALLVASMYLIKPINREILDDAPSLLKPILMPFSN